MTGKKSFARSRREPSVCFVRGARRQLRPGLHRRIRCGRPGRAVTDFWTVVSRSASANYEADVSGTASVSEPGTLAIAAAGLLSLWGWLRRGKY